MTYTYRYEARQIGRVWHVVQLAMFPGGDEVRICSALNQMVAEETALAMTARRLAA